MANRFNAHVRSDKAKWILVALALLLVGVILCGLMTNWFKDMNPFCWFGHNYDESGKCIRCGADKPAEEPEQANGNVVIETVMARGMSLDAAPVALADNPDTYTLTATISPASADDKRVEWTVAWKNANAMWAVGKTVTDYVTVTPTSANALTATVVCVKDFGEQIIVTVTSLDNEEATAACTVDYVQRITGFTFNMPSVSSASTSFTYDIEYSNYTIAAEVSFDVSDKLTLTDSFVENYVIAASELNCTRQDMIVVPADLKIKNNQLVIEQPNESGDGGFYDGLHSDDCYWAEKDIVGCFIGIEMYNFSSVKYDYSYAMKWFIAAVNNTSGNHAEFTISYSTTYNGKTYSQGTKTVGVVFDGQALHIPVNSVSLSQSSIVF